jgi:hypothetical protein
MHPESDPAPEARTLDDGTVLLGEQVVPGLRHP